ncbi:MAG: tRNA (adenosine(37)-N6)-threonylcarbamoyltransferase complex dimerization subunit type 1 TsaB [Patescibacteria group bacterium]
MSNRSSCQPLLIIDTATPAAMVAVITNKVISQQTGDSLIRADDLLTLIDQALQVAKLQPADIYGICVRRGLGSYTGLRVGVTVANTLAWATQKPVIGLLSTKMVPLNLDSLAQRYQSLRQRLATRASQNKPSPVVPKYGRWQPLTPSAKIKESS